MLLHKDIVAAERISVGFYLVCHYTDSVKALAYTYSVWFVYNLGFPNYEIIMFK